jgi:hypothetical protein
MRIPSTSREPAVDPSDRTAADLPSGEDLNDHQSAETDVADGVNDLSAHALDDLPNDGPLNFDDGTDMGHPRGDTRRTGGSWDAEGTDQGRLKPPSEMSSTPPPSSRR